MNTAITLKYKICPYCAIPLMLDADICFHCKHKVRRINKYGIANRPVNIWSYVSAATSWIGFYLYMRWAFF